MAVAITQTALPAAVTPVSNVSTFSGVAIGTASPERVVALVIGKEVLTVTPTLVTVGGVTATLATGNTLVGAMGAWLYYVGFPSGTTADITITWSGTIADTQYLMGVYEVSGAHLAPTQVGNDGSTDMDATSPLLVTNVVIPTNGGCLAIAVGSTAANAKSWTNLTEDIDQSTGGTFRFTTATSLTAGTANRSCQGTSNGEDGALALAVWREVDTLRMQAIM